MDAHPWTLVGPWYRAESAGGGAPRRSRRPIFQKYGSADFVDRFMTEPQSSLRFLCEDLANKLCSDPFTVVGPGDDGQGADPLKLFLDTHSRFYLVVCELHCVAPGFPSVNRDKVCEAGFVIRRRRTVMPAEASLPLKDALKARNAVKTKLVKVDEQAAIPQAGKRRSVRQLVVNSLDGFRDKQRSRLEGQLDEVERELQKLYVDFDVKSRLEGWVPSRNTSGVGAWGTVEETPAEVTEQILPLFPLIPDPTLKNHSVSGKSLWFGVVPTFSADVDGDGFPRFDDQHLYEVRCFVRRHKPQCPKKSARNDCKGALVWSAPTETYRLAAFFDLDGGGHRPINITLPDLDALEQQASAGAPGKGANVRMIAPENSGLQFTPDGMDLPTGTGVRSLPQVCFFAIPLITIVALFLFRLVLPIVVFLFQLWFLLKLKLCIPPSLSLDVDLAADLQVHGPEFEASIEAQIAIEGSIMIGGVEYFDAADVFDAMAAEINADPSLDPNLKAGLTGELDFDELADIYVSMSTDFSDDPANPDLAGDIPRPEDGLVYFDVVQQVAT